MAHRRAAAAAAVDAAAFQWMLPIPPTILSHAPAQTAPLHTNDCAEQRRNSSIPLHAPLRVKSPVGSILAYARPALHGIPATQHGGLEPQKMAIDGC